MSRFIFKLLALSCTLSCGVAMAQISSATLIGTVTDSSGAAVAGAVVDVKNEATQTSRSATTELNGEYTIPELPAAHYTLTIRKTGFRTFNAPEYRTAGCAAGPDQCDAPDRRRWSRM